MVKTYKQTILACLLTFVLVLAPAADVLGFGKGAQGPDVHAVQAMLKSMGYFPATITGYYGSRTEEAVRKFQADYGLPVTGAVDDKTLQSILWAYGNAKIPKKPAPAPKPPTPSQPPAAGLSAEERQMVDLVNQARQAEGLPPLTADPELSRVARIKSQDMVSKNYFSHQSPTYGSPFDMMKKFGISFRSAGENIACNRSVQAAHQALLESPGHRANIMSRDFNRIGIGIVDGGPCGKMFTQMFIGR